MQEETLTQEEKLTPKEGEVFDLIIIGAGPAGMSAAVCAGRANLKTLVIEKALPGGQISTAFHIDNQLGFPGGILGDDLAKLMEDHIFNYNIFYSCEKVEDVSDLKNGNKLVSTDLNHSYEAKKIIIAVGLDPKKMNSSFENKFIGRGISYFARCDGESYIGKNVAVIGGGNCACYAADYLAQFADQVYLIHRSDQIKAVESLKLKIAENSKITIMWDSDLTEVFGIDKVEKAKITNILNGQYTWIDVKGIFIYVGRIPTKDIINLDLDTDEKGYLITDEYMRTNVKGIYAAGDIRAKQIRQIPTAISDGMIAAINIGKELQDRPLTNN